MQDQEKNVLRMPEALIEDMNAHLPGRLTIGDIQKLCYGRKFRVLFLRNETLDQTDFADMLDLSVRSANALKRAGYMTIGDLLNRLDSFDELDKIRNCGAKSKAEIMGKLFFYQYSLISQEQRSAYMERILELNEIGKK